MQLVAVRQLRSTTLGPGQQGITFAHSEHNHPVPGITVTTGHVPHVSACTAHVYLQVHTYEEIVPTRSYVPHSRTFATAYSVVTHTATVTQDTAGGEQTLYTITNY